jgi:hypothetical protein
MDKDWCSLALNPSAVTSIYDSAPSLSCINISEIRLLDRGPTIQLFLSLADLPSRVPLRWAKHPFNRVSISLQLIEVDSVKVQNWKTDNFGRMEIEKLDGKLHSSIVNGSEKIFECVHSFLTINSFAPYQVEEE